MTSSTIVITGSGLFFLIIMSSLFVPFVSSLGLLRTNNRIEPRNNKRAAIVTPIFPRRSSIVSLDPLFMVEHEE